MKKITLLSVVLLILSIPLQGQEITNRFSINPVNFLGKWTATESGMTYELELVRELVLVQMEDEPDSYRNMVLGKITYRKGGAIIRETEFDGFGSMMYHWNILSSHRAVFVFRDELRKVRAHVELIIDEINPSQALFKLVRYEKWNPGWNENKIDIPDGITFYKVVE